VAAAVVVLVLPALAALVVAALVHSLQAQHQVLPELQGRGLQVAVVLIVPPMLICKLAEAAAVPAQLVLTGVLPVVMVALVRLHPSQVLRSHALAAVVVVNALLVQRAQVVLAGAVMGLLMPAALRVRLIQAAEAAVAALAPQISYAQVALADQVWSLFQCQHPNIVVQQRDRPQ
jgi:hypothetical protein